MNSINKPTQDNIAGLVRLFFKPSSEVTSVMNPVQNKVSSISVSGSWYEFYFTPGTMNYSENINPGSVFEKRLSFFTPGDNYTLLTQLRELLNTKMVVVFKDTDGQYRVMGSKNAGCRFTYSFTSGSIPGEQKGYNCTFIITDNNPSYFVNSFTEP